ncbi:MAG: MCP four helix bundle domain-containing protein [Calditrichaceae bacterium]
MKIKNLKLSRKLFLGFGFILLMMITVNMFSIHQMNILKSEIDNFNNQWLPSAMAISSLNLNTSELRRNQLQYAFTTDEGTRNDLAAAMILSIDKINENLDTYARLKAQKSDVAQSPEEERHLFSSFENDWEMYQDLSFNIVQLSRQNKQEKAFDLLNGQTKLIYNNINENLQKLLNFYETEVLSGARNANLTFQATKKLITSLLIITMILSLLFVIWLIRWIKLPIRRLEKGAKLVAEGD